MWTAKFCYKGMPGAGQVHSEKCQLTWLASWYVDDFLGSMPQSADKLDPVELLIRIAKKVTWGRTNILTTLSLLVHEHSRSLHLFIPFKIFFI